MKTFFAFIITLSSGLSAFSNPLDINCTAYGLDTVRKIEIKNVDRDGKYAVPSFVVDGKVAKLASVGECDDDLYCELSKDLAFYVIDPRTETGLRVEVIETGILSSKTGKGPKGPVPAKITSVDIRIKRLQSTETLTGLCFTN